jgi:hypothetical protein
MFKKLLSLDEVHNLYPVFPEQKLQIFCQIFGGKWTLPNPKKNTREGRVT